jgi:hypothetical protein
MICEWSWARTAARLGGLSGAGEVVHPCDTEHGVVRAIAFETAVTEDLPGLHAGEDVFNAGADLFVGRLVGLLPLGQFLALASPVGHHEPVPG